MRECRIFSSYFFCFTRIHSFHVFISFFMNFGRHFRRSKIAANLLPRYLHSQFIRIDWSLTSIVHFARRMQRRRRRRRTQSQHLILTPEIIVTAILHILPHRTATGRSQLCDESGTKYSNSFSSVDLEKAFLWSRIASGSLSLARVGGGGLQLHFGICHSATPMGIVRE